MTQSLRPYSHNARAMTGAPDSNMASMYTLLNSAQEHAGHITAPRRARTAVRDIGRS